MGRTSSLLSRLACLSIGLLGQVAVAAPHPYSVDDLLRLYRVSDPQVTPDERLLFFTQSQARLDGNRWQGTIWVQSLSQTGLPLGPAQQFTFPEHSGKGEGQDFSPRLSPSANKLAFVSTRDGGAPQLYVMPIGGGEARRLTSVPSGASDPMWTPDGRGLVFTSKVYADCPPLPAGDECNRKRSTAQEQSPVQARIADRLFYRHWDDWFDGKRKHVLRVMLPDSPSQPVSAPVDLTPGDFDAPPIARGGDEPYAISPDGKELVFVQNRDRDVASSTNSDLWAVPLGKDFVPAGQPRNLTSKNLASDIAPRFSHDGRFLAFLAQRRPGFEADRWEVWLHDRVTGQYRSLTEKVDLTAHELTWSDDNQRIYFVTSVKGRRAIMAVDISGQQAPIEIGQGDASELQLVRGKSGPALYFSRGSLQRPPEVFRIDLDAMGKATGPASQVTKQNDAVLAELRPGPTSQLFARSQDGLTLHSHVITPPDFTPTQKYPAVVIIHGGPQGAWEDAWHWRWNAQLFAGAGYVVLLANPRGSEGFGQKFVDQVSGDWGGRAYDDVMKLTDVLAQQPYIDAKRIGAAGASYGGYMVNWLAGHTDRFAALVSHAGVFDLRSMAGETEEQWFPRWEFGGDSWQSDQHDRFSPSRFVDKFKTPMLVIAGERDYRVPAGQALQLFTALQHRKVPSRLLLFPGENHWVGKPLHTRLWYGTVLDWLSRYMGGTKPDPKIIDSATTIAK